MTLLEICFADVNLGADLDLTSLNEEDSVKVLFSENSGIVFQAEASVETILSENSIEFFNIGTCKPTYIPKFDHPFISKSLFWTRYRTKTC